ncbi:MAG: CBS domain-containing protein [Rhodoferax sp.]|nr:CBS domain-containing protein [Rhodoferax sp.]MDP3654603.1 CBS domain-containing protein [Rhodoferax sp.]
MIDPPLHNNVPTTIVSISTGRPVSDALKLMNASKSSYVLVMDGLTTIGIITERDMTVLLEDSFSGANWRDITVENVMTSPLVTVPWDSTLLESIDVMRNRKIRHTPVQDDAGLTIGVITPQVVIDLLYRNWNDD